jgi:hypothetical protein
MHSAELDHVIFVTRTLLPARCILVSEVGGSDRIGFTGCGYDRKYVTAGVTSNRFGLKSLLNGRFI